MRRCILGVRSVRSAACGALRQLHAYDRRTIRPVWSSISHRRQSGRSGASPDVGLDTASPNHALPIVNDTDQTYHIESQHGKWALSLPSAVAASVCIGLPLGFPLAADFVSRDIGVVASTVTDWSCGELLVPGAVFLGTQALTSALASKWQEEVGPVVALSMSSVLLGCGMAVAAAGVHIHQLSMLHAGIGCLAGAAAGLAYSPVIRGVVTSATEPKVGFRIGSIVLGSGIGASILPACLENLASVFRTLPTFLGSRDGDLSVTEFGGKLYAVVEGFPTEVVESVATLDTIAQGFYVVGSGGSGIAEAMAVVAAVSSIALYAASQRFHYVHIPASENITPPDTIRVVEKAAQAMDFNLLGISAAILAMAGTFMFTIGPALINEVLVEIPDLASIQLTSIYSGGMTASVLGGCLLWPVIADKIGHRETFYALTLGYIPVFLSIPVLVELTAQTASSWLMMILLANTLFGCSAVGGLFGIVPTYLFGLFEENRMVSHIGKSLLYINGGILSGAAVIPSLNAYSKTDAYVSMLKKLPSEQLQESLGSPIEKITELISSNSISLDKIAAITPSDIPNPSLHIFDQSVTLMALAVMLSAIAHARVLNPTDQSIFKLEKIDFTKPPDDKDKHRYSNSRATAEINVSAASGHQLRQMGIAVPKKRKRLPKNPNINSAIQK